MRWIIASLIIPLSVLSLGCHELAGLADLEIPTATGSGGQATTSGSGGAGGAGAAGGSGAAGGAYQCVGTADNTTNFQVNKQFGDEADQYSPRIGSAGATKYWLVGNNGGTFAEIPATDVDDLFALKLGISFQI